MVSEVKKILLSIIRKYLDCVHLVFIVYLLSKDLMFLPLMFHKCSDHQASRSTTCVVGDAIFSLELLTSESWSCTCLLFYSLSCYLDI